MIAIDDQAYDPEVMKIIQGKSHIYLEKDPEISLKSILSLNKTLIYLTHGSFHSYLESIESKTAMLVVPQKAVDNLFNCELV